MKLKDIYGHQLVALVRPYNGLHKGLQGLLITANQEKALVVLKNRSKTIEQIPIEFLIGIVSDSE
ncbi:hypothetical protein FDH01_gp254 [Acinetobacter phage vB_AbaM_ME3]|uniref:Uncharacterized protein n=1 Tax=Acinetobacter phage vB_AbaM_ME3 TaxID=1837876 RepID=A0A172Q0H6_9CAUD|nr:hypothetical protein FDH01_gp254 [Acinetobacter phage vB_AbaM_ME3]AND75368.1 hypothetical protein ME3_207 [Acinetobacter phage vB_AbaM_ME3]